MATQTDCVLCLGCGEVITSRTTDRRVLQGTSVEHVVSVWRAMLENAQADVDEGQVDADVILSGGGVPSKAGKMCRKCFAAYDRYHKLHETLQINLAKAVGTQSEVSSSSKRPRLNAPRMYLPPLQITVGQSSVKNTSSSPDVSVRTYRSVSKSDINFV